jgi:hypothetical protein
MNVKPEYRTEEMVEKLAKAGFTFSRQLRGCFNVTGYPFQSTLRRKDYTGVESHPKLLDALGLVGYSDCADLDTFYPGRPDQWNWDLHRWRREVRHVVLRR